MVRRGQPSLTTFANTAPQLDLVELTSELAIPGVHSGHLLRRLWQEATEAGELARCGKDLLFRALCASLRESTGDPGDFLLRLEDALHQWRNHLPRNYQFVADLVWSTLIDVTPPNDRLPQSANDSILAALIHQHWPAAQPGSRYRMTYDAAGGLTIVGDRGTPKATRW